MGAVIVRDGEVVGRGRNRRETLRHALAHAELEAIDDAAAGCHGWRLFGSTLYVTLEPCPMCAGAIINARIDRVVYGAADPKAGSCGSLTDLFALPYNHHPPVGKRVDGRGVRRPADRFLPLPEGKEPAGFPVKNTAAPALFLRTQGRLFGFP